MMGTHLNYRSTNLCYDVARITARNGPTELGC
jgi:hypothetical protein